MFAQPAPTAAQPAGVSRPGTPTREEMLAGLTCHPDGKLAVIVFEVCPRLRAEGFVFTDEFFDVAHGRFE